MKFALDERLVNEYKEDYLVGELGEDDFRVMLKPGDGVAVLPTTGSGEGGWHVNNWKLRV